MWSLIATILPLLHLCRAMQVNFIKEDPRQIGYVYKNTNAANKLYYSIGSNWPVVVEYNKKMGLGKYYKTRQNMAKWYKEAVPKVPFVLTENEYAIPTTKDGKTLYSQMKKYISNRHTRPSYHTNHLRVDLPTDLNVDAAKSFQRVYSEKFYSMGLISLPISNNDFYMVNSPDNYYFPFDDFSNRGYQSNFDGKEFAMIKPKLAAKPAEKSWKPDYGNNVDLNRILQRINLLKKQVDSKFQAEDDESYKNKIKKEQSTTKPKERVYKSDDDNNNRRGQSTSGLCNNSDTYRNSKSLVNGYHYKKSRDVKNYEYMDVVAANRKALPIEYSEISDQFGYNKKDLVRISRNLRPELSHHANASGSYLIKSRTRRITTK